VGGVGGLRRDSPWTEDTAQTSAPPEGGRRRVPAAAPPARAARPGPPVGAYWGEFKARGKERVTVRQLLRPAGVPALDNAADPRAGGGADVRAAGGGRARRRSSAGRRHGYHAQTYSWRSRRLVLRASGGRPSAVHRRGDRPPAGPGPVAGAAAGRGAPGGPDRRRPHAQPPASGGLRARPKQSVHDA